MLYISDNAGYFPHNGNLLVDSEVVVGDKHVKCDPYLSNIAALFGGLFRLNTSGYVVMCSYTVSTSIVSFQASAYTQTSWFAGVNTNMFGCVAFATSAPSYSGYSGILLFEVLSGVSLGPQFFLSLGFPSLSISTISYSNSIVVTLSATTSFSFSGTVSSVAVLGALDWTNPRTGTASSQFVHLIYAVLQTPITFSANQPVTYYLTLTFR
jgi:hypothetical protein